MTGHPRLTSLGALAFACVVLAACASKPETRAEEQVAIEQARAAVAQMTERDPTLQEVLDSSFGYVVIPRVREIASGVGGTRGVGVAFERGEPVGYSRLRQISTGTQIGAQQYAQIVVFQTPAAFERLRSGTFDLTAQATATALGRGSARQARFRNGVATFVMPERGALVGVSVAGQQLSFEPIV